MRTLIVFALVGFGAQLVDGALGMAYGVVVGVWIAAVAIAVSKFRTGPREVVGDPTTDQPVSPSGEVIDSERS